MYREEIEISRQAVATRREWQLEAVPFPLTSKQSVRYSVVIVLLLLVAWLGARGLNADALWYDEVWSLYYAGGAENGPISPLETIERVAAQLQHEKNPPGYYIALNLWGGLVGWSEFAGRALSWLAGMLVVAWTYRLGYDFSARYPAASRRLIALAAALVVGCSAFFIYYTHELRAYVPSVLCTTFTLWAYWRILNAKGKPSILLESGLVLGGAAALYTHYLSALVLVSMGLYHLLIAPKNGRWWRLTLLGLISGALFLPWVGSLVIAAERAEDLVSFALPVPQMLDSLAYAFSNGSIAFMVLPVIYALRARGKSARAAWFLAVGGILLAVILNAVYPVITHLRYLIVLWPMLALVVGLGVERMARAGVPAVLMLGIWVGAGMWNTVNPDFDRSLSAMIVPLPWREIRAELQTYGQPDDVVVVHAPRFNWFRELEIQHYMTGLPMRYSLLEQIPGTQAGDDYYQQSKAYLADAPRVWLGEDNTFPASFRLFAFQRALADDYVPCLSAAPNADMSLDLYRRVPSRTDSLPYQFGDGIEMQTVDPVRVLPDGNLSVMLGWKIATDVPTNAYSVALHVVDAQGKLVAQADYGLPRQTYSCTPTQISVKPGTYTVMALVYGWQTGERMPGLDVQRGESFDRIPIATIDVQ
jgi:dolichyl-phosphate-mannose-protein mannosyltransferase